MKKLPLFIYPSIYCNYECSYCFTRSDNKKSLNTYVINNWNSILSNAKEVGVTEIRLSGGEPLAMNDLDKMLLSISNYNFNYTITTNGTLLKSKKNELKLYPPSFIWISYHREYQKYASWIKILEMASNITSSIGVNIFISDLSIINYDLEKLYSIGVKRIKILEETAIGRNFDKYISNKIHQDRLYKLIMSAKKYKIECRIEGKINYRGDVGVKTCILNEKLLLSIDPDGDVYPCCVVVGNKNLSIGSLQNFSLSQIISNYKNTGLHCKSILPEIFLEKKKCPLVLDPLP